MIKNICYIILLIFISLSCNSKNDKVKNEHAKIVSNNKYAQGFCINYTINYKEIIVYSPWIKETIYARYYLVKNAKTKTPSNGIKVQIPLNSIAATSVTHFEFLKLLGELKTITGVCSPNIIYNKEINQALKENKITSLGDAFNINLEKTMQLKPNAVMMSGYNQNDPYAERVEQAGIPVIINNEWMETSILARAEWIKFIAAFYNKEALADSIFSDIDKRYNQIKAKAAQLKNKPNIMTGSNFRGTWYMPSGRNFMGKLYADAGAQYFYSNDTTAGSLPLNFETVLKYFSASDFWLNCNFNTLDELLNADTKHKLFQPVSKNKVYNFNKRLLPTMANDFWESAVARPDLVLSDVIAILHPELLPDYKLVYATQLLPRK